MLGLMILKMPNREINHAPEFKTGLKKLKKRHIGLRVQIEDLLKYLAATEVPLGDKMPDVGGEESTYKVRVALGNQGSARVLA